MQKKIFVLPELSLLILLLLSFNTAEKRSLASTGGPIVELFTSEGCSSCPPADEAVAKIAKEYGNQVHVICYHVDYWDRLGWKDFYSNPAFTERQKEYSQAFHLNSFYTPQAIVNGRTEFVGSDDSRLHKTVENELKIPALATIEISVAQQESKQITVSYKITNGENNILNIVLVQTHAETNVKKGENEGKVLHHFNIARKLITVELLKESSGMVNLSIPRELSARDCKIIAFTQSPKTMQITGSTEAGIGQ